MSAALLLGGGAYAPGIARLIVQKGFRVAVQNEADVATGDKIVAVPADISDVDQLVAEAASICGGPISCCVNGMDLATRSCVVAHEVGLAVMEAMAHQDLRLEKDALGELLAPYRVINLINHTDLEEGPALLSRKLARMALKDITEAGAEAFAPAFRVNAISLCKPDPAPRKAGRSGPGDADLLAALAYLMDAPAVTGQVFSVELS